MFPGLRWVAIVCRERGDNPPLGTVAWCAVNRETGSGKEQTLEMRYVRALIALIVGSSHLSSLVQVRTCVQTVRFLIPALLDEGI